MLKIVRRFSQLDFNRLLDVYEQTYTLEAKRNFPDLSDNEQFLRQRECVFDYLKNDFFRRTDSFYAIWELQGEYVAALRLEPYKDGLLLEALETAVQERKKGYARALMAALNAYLAESKWQKVYSHIHKKNISSIAVHTSSGFVQIADHAAFIDGSASYESYTFCLHIKK